MGTRPNTTERPSRAKPVSAVPAADVAWWNETNAFVSRLSATTHLVPAIAEMINGHWAALTELLKAAASDPSAAALLASEREAMHALLRAPALHARTLWARAEYLRLVGGRDVWWDDECIGQIMRGWLDVRGVDARSALVDAKVDQLEAEIEDLVTDANVLFSVVSLLESEIEHAFEVRHASRDASDPDLCYFPVRIDTIDRRLWLMGEAYSKAYDLRARCRKLDAQIASASSSTGFDKVKDSALTS